MAEKKQLPGLITGLVAMLAVAAFMILGFTTGAWHLVWLVFLAVPITGIIADMFVKRNEKYGSVVGIVAIVVSLVYVVLGFFANLWHPGWLMFLLVPITGVIVEMITKPKKEDSLIGLVVVLAVITFLLLGFFAGMWHIAWIVFLLIPITAIVMQIVKAAKNEIGSGTTDGDSKTTDIKE